MIPNEQDGAPREAAPFTLPVEHEETLRTLAEDVLRRSFEILAQERVLPRSQYRPWIQMGRDYPSHAVESEGPLSEALEAALPARFVRTPMDATMDYPWFYGSALLEAAVASATRAHEPYAVTSPSVRAVVDEFVAKVQAPPATTSLQVVTDMEVVTDKIEEAAPVPLGETIHVAGVDIIRVGATPETYIEQELRSAGYDVERDQVVSWPGPVSLLVARVARALGFDARSREVRRRLRNVVTAVRLATGASASPLVTIDGEPGGVPTMHPRIRPHPPRGMRLAHRPTQLGPGDVTGLEVLCCRIDDWLGADDLEASPLGLAIGQLNRSLDGPSTTVADIVVDLSIGLEAALAGNDTSEVGLRLRVRAADLLATTEDPSDVIYQDVKQLYRVRSSIVHGNVLKPGAFLKSIARVSSAGASSRPGEQVALALDRWRDLLRRAILARAALATEASLWPLRHTGDVDRELRTESTRTAWLGHIREYWTVAGLPSALSPAPPMQLALSRETDRRPNDNDSRREAPAS